MGRVPGRRLRRPRPLHGPRSGRPLWLALCAGLSLWLAGALAPALAHDVPAGVLMVDIGRDALDVELQLQLNQLELALQLPANAAATDIIPRYGARIEDYLRQRLHFTAPDGHPFELRTASLAMQHTHNANWTSNDWVVFRGRLQAPAGASTETFTIADTAVLERVLSYKTLVYIRRDVRNGLLGDKPLPVGMILFGRTEMKVDGSDGGWVSGFGHLFALGLRHIAEGTDHMLFLLALLLPAPLLAARGRWRGYKGTRAGVQTIVAVVSGFTLGHSVSLALAATGVVSVPTALIEVLIAVTILVSSLHAWRPVFAGRKVWIATGFGLIHGLAFAETLSGLNFDATTLVLSLLGFNLGIEAMQLVVIALVLPPLLLARTRAYPAIRTAGAAFAATCAVGWIAERAFGLANPLAPVVNWLAPPPLWFVTALAVASAASLCGLWLRSTAATAGRFRPPPAAATR